MNCKQCGSDAINHHMHGRDGTEPELCDVCYWRRLATAHNQVWLVTWAVDDGHRAVHGVFENEALAREVADGMTLRSPAATYSASQWVICGVEKESQVKLDSQK